MIGSVIRTLLINTPAVAALIGDRMKAIKFAQAEDLPALMYSTDNLQPLACRNGGGVYYGTLELSLLAKRYAEIEQLLTVIRLVLDNFSGVVDGWSLSIEAGIEGPDDEDIELQAYYKRIDFFITAERQ
ncbi:hypothetical protein BN8_03659 [Fibrisoma limi BUZ 3]|uniref:DUF3168 domain-containing protein n=1 Tax=Fibrisoma limi BUZ 3 TaxID=1185876 RepID=I2GKQ8_9BACT|nr:hypothetical protein [Fibrisoma limi]CCH54484.1 hypothetical protein BN8_03659 [Fibrisoma limi BUZ 3]